MKERIKPILKILVLLALFSYFSACFDSGDSDSSSSSSNAQSTMDQLGDIQVDLPRTLSTDGATRENIDYSSLSEIKSQAFSEFLRNVGEFEENVDEVNKILGEMKAGIAEGGLSENQVFTEQWEEGTFKFKYNYQKAADGTNYLILRSAEFDTANTLRHGTYFEVATDASGAPVKGQAQLTGNFSDTEASGSYKIKLVFDETKVDQKGYFEFNLTFADGTTMNEKGEIRIIGDTEDTKNGVFVATRFESDEYGVSQNLGWANDEYGGVMSYHKFTDPGSSQTMEDVYTEYFKYNDSTQKSAIIYREWGTKNPGELFWDINEARQTLAAGTTPTNWKNIYKSGIASAPEKITVKYDETYGVSKSYTIYAGEVTSGEVLSGPNSVSLASDEPWQFDRYFWLNTSSNQISVGDAVYYFNDITENWGPGSGTATSTYIKASEVPVASNYMDKSGYYIENMYPLIYVTGNHPVATGKTMIQKQLVDWNGNGTAEPEDDWNENGLLDDYLYYLDLDGSGDWMEPWEAAQANAANKNNNAKAEPEIMVWNYPEFYYDEEKDEVVEEKGIYWLFGSVPTVDANSDGVNDVSYLYQTEKDSAKAKFEGSTDYITAISITPFDVSGAEWEEITTGSF